MGQDVKNVRNSQDYNRPVTDEAIFKGAKEIVVKFIEMGRLTPGNFDETFDKVYKSVRKTVRGL